MLQRAIFLIFVWIFLLAKAVFAADTSSFYKTTYEFSRNGEASVSQEISLVNKSADFYVSEYSLSLSGGKIFSIEAYDKIGPLKTNTVQKEESTIITLKFNEKVVGKEKVLSFILKYKISGLAKKQGNLWHVSLPKLANLQEIKDYQLFLKIPDAFGKIAAVNPTPRSEEQSSNWYIFSFQKEDLAKFGVLATFGQYQTFEFRLFYDLANEALSAGEKEIALPPDTDYQTVYSLSLDPEPKEVKTDSDGNWLARYQLATGQKLRVKADGKVDVFSQPKMLINENNFSSYLVSQKYWETESPEIQDLARQLKTPENIYNFVVQKLVYDYNRASLPNPVRKGALTALKEPNNSLCTEFTDLFIALSRAAGIPARELEGYASTDNRQLADIALNNDLLHSWPEYFDKKTNRWIWVDPTWGNTTGGLDFFNKQDMARVVFAIHGVSDSYPPPAGSYKESYSLGKQVFVSFSSAAKVAQKPSLSVENVLPSSIYAGKSTQAVVTLKNKSGFALDPGLISPSSPYILSSSVESKKPIPPGGTVKFFVLLKPQDLLKDTTVPLEFKLDSAAVVYNLSVKSLFFRLIVFGGSFLSVTLIFLLLILRRKIYSKTKPDMI